MIPDSLFSPSQSPVFALLKVLVSPSSKSWFCSVPSPLRVPFPSSSDSRFFLSILFRPPSPVPVLPDSSSILSKSSPTPLPQSQRKQRNDTKPSRRSWLVWLVPKWNMILSLLECLPNNPLDNVEYSYHSTP